MLTILYFLLALFVLCCARTIYSYVIKRKNPRFFIKKTFEPSETDVRSSYFASIASFVSIAEVLPAQQLVEWVNEYLTAMTDILLAEGGTLESYSGDKIVAFFGAPLGMPDHAARALRTALKMQHALAHLREKWAAAEDKYPDLVKQMRMRIGIASGDMVAGIRGSTRNKNYMMMGDAVIIASGLEELGRRYGLYLQCTKETLTLAGADDFAWRPIDKVLFSGRSKHIETVEIVALSDQLTEPQRQLHRLFNHALTLYRNQEWDAAIKAFTESAQYEEHFTGRPTTPSRVYIERCEFLQDNPPGEDWDGSWTLSPPTAGKSVVAGRTGSSFPDLALARGETLTLPERTELVMHQVEDLVDTGAPNQGQRNSLIAKLEAAIQSLNQGNTTAASHQLQAFINQGKAFINGEILTPEEGEPLIEAASGIRDHVGW